MPEKATPAVTARREGVAPSLQTVSSGALRFVPLGELRESYARLRPGALAVSPNQLAPLPLRVAPTQDGHFEILDGFKRVAQLRESDQDYVPVVVEPTTSAIDHKRLILLANSPQRTLTPLDEARIVRSLVHDDGLTARAAAKVLGRKPSWVARRLSIATRLSVQAEECLAQGRINLSVAHALTTLSPDEQASVLEAALAKGLRTADLLRLIHSYCVADRTDRRELLRDPVGALQREPGPTVSAHAAQLEARLEHARDVLDELRAFTIPDGLAPPEKRRLAAVRQTVIKHLVDTAGVLEPALAPSPASANDKEVTDGHSCLPPCRRERAAEASDDAIDLAGPAVDDSADRLGSGEAAGACWLPDDVLGASVDGTAGPAWAAVGSPATGP